MESAPNSVSSTPPSVPPNVPSPPDGASKPSKTVPIIATLALLGAAVFGYGIYSFFPGNLISFKAPGPKKEPIIIGGILPLTGDAASYGVPVQQAAILAQNEINKAGGIAGREVRIEWKDGRCEAADALRSAHELIDTYHPLFILGGVCSGEFLAAAPIAQAAKIISLTSSATNPDISKLGKYVFRTATSDALAGRVAAQYAKNNLGAKKAAIIAENKPYPLGLQKVFTESFVAGGGTVVASELYETGATDFKDTIAKINAAKPDVIYILPQTSAPGVVIVKELKAQHATAALLTAEVLLIRDAVSEQGDVLEGVTGVEAYFDKDSPKAAAMLSNYTRTYGKAANYPIYMAGMYDLLYLMKEAYEKTDGSADAMSEYLYALKKWPGAVGPITFDRNGDPLLPYQIEKITNHNTEIIDIVNLTP